MVLEPVGTIDEARAHIEAIERLLDLSPALLADFLVETTRSTGDGAYARYLMMAAYRERYAEPVPCALYTGRFPVEVIVTAEDIAAASATSQVHPTGWMSAREGARLRDGACPEHGDHCEYLR